MKASRPPVILLVDDDLEFLLETREALARETCVVLVAQELQGARWLLEREPVDVLVCDLKLINEDGRDLLTVVRERWPSVARILVTGFDCRVNEPRTFPAAQAVLVKPIDIGHLLFLLECLPTSLPKSATS